jgi:hypothetical protein
MAAHKFKVVIVLDAINQLSSEHDALSLSWLPTSLPKNSSIRIICSMIDNDPQVSFQCCECYLFKLFRA